MAQHAKLPKAEAREAEETSEAKPSRFGLKKFDRASLYKPQGPDSGINAVIGKWPGDETDEEINALLEKLS